MLAVTEGKATKFPVVIPYLGIFLRDHFEEVTDVPWWAVRAGDIETNLQVTRDLQEKLALDWVCAGGGYSRQWRENHEVLLRGERAFSISLEESKKNFVIDIEKVDNIANGRVCLFGNVDAIGILQDGSRQTIAEEIQRQTTIGNNSGRFVMSLGSPVTPSTPTAKVREFVDMAREVTV